MTRRPQPSSGGEAQIPIRADQDGSEPLASDDSGGTGSPPENPWMRRMVYVCAALGMTLAILLLLRPQPPAGDPQSRASTCGPCCR